MKITLTQALKSIPYVIIVVLIVIIFFLQRCSTRKQNAYIANIEDYKDTAKTFKNKLGATVSYNEVLEAQNREQLSTIVQKDKQLFLLQKDFKTVESATSIKTVIQLVHDTVRFKDSIPCNFEPFYFNDSNKFYTMKAYIAPSFFSLDTLSMYNTQSIVIGEKKVSFWKKAERRIEIQNSNPYFITTNIGSYVISEQKKWYNTNIFKFGVGFVAGFFTNSKVK